MQKDFSALLTDGKASFMEISADGYISNYISNAKIIEQNLFAPFRHLKLASLATGSKIGVCLNEQGDVMGFKNRRLLF